MIHELKSTAVLIPHDAKARERFPDTSSHSPVDLRRRKELAARFRTEVTDGHFGLIPFISAATMTSCSSRWKTSSMDFITNDSISSSKTSLCSACWLVRGACQLAWLQIVTKERKKEKSCLNYHPGSSQR